MSRTASPPSASHLPPLGTTAPKRAGLVVRVSTTRQADNDEGSLKTQLQRLRAHIQYRQACGEDWQEVQVYELKAVSGEHSLHSSQLAQLQRDIAAGRVNTVVCCALARASRNVTEFLQFVEFLNTYGVEFVSLKEQVDTTSSHGKLILTVLIALAQFEREQTSERTKDAEQARTERGLHNGGRLLGYDLDPDHKGLFVGEPR